MLRRRQNMNTTTNRTKSVLHNSVLEMNVKNYKLTCALKNVDKYGINYFIDSKQFLARGSLEPITIVGEIRRHSSF